jgi:hypothetical protein
MEAVTLSKEDLSKLLEAAIRAAKAPNVLEQKAIDEAIEKEKRRNLLMKELGKAEQETMLRRKNGCSHSRHPQGSGKRAGQPAPRGQGEWTTGGQLVGRDLAVLCCLRCAWTWQWQPTYEEREFILNEGMLGMAPPPADRLLAEG